MHQSSDVRSGLPIGLVSRDLRGALGWGVHYVTRGPPAVGGYGWP